MVLLVCSFPSKSNVDLSVFTNMSNIMLYKKGTTHFATQSDSAIYYYSVLYNRYNDDMPMIEKKMCAEALLNTGILHYKKNNYSEAMDIWLNGLNICRSNDIDDVLSQIYVYIGNIYSVHCDYEQGVSFYKKALESARKSDNVELQNHSLNNLVSSLCYCDSVQEARKYYDMLLGNAQDQRSRYRYDVLMNQALLLSCETNFPMAILYYLQAVHLVEIENLSAQCMGAAYNGLAKIYVQENKLDSALYFFHRNEELARRSGTIDLLAVSLGNLATIYERKGDAQNAYRYKKLFIYLNDSIFNQREFNSLKNAQFLYELNNNNEKISQLTVQKYYNEQKINRQRLLIITISIGLLIGGILLIFISIQKRRLSVAYNELYNRNQESLKRESVYKNRLLTLREMYESRREPVLPQASTGKEDIDENDEKNCANGIFIPDELRVKISHGIIVVMENEDEICNNNFNMARLATLVGSNTRYVSQVINDDYGVNFRTLLNECRVKVAMKRMSDNEHYGIYTIKAISESVGYKSQANFIRVFTQYTGIKPSMYQKISRERT